MSDDDDDEYIESTLKEEEQKALVEMIAERLALALRATAAHYRHCDPLAPSVLGTLGDYVANPEKASDRLKREKESLRRLGRAR